LIERDAKVNDADSPWLRSLEFYKKLQNQGCFNNDITTAQFENSVNLMLEGKIAMVSLHSGFVDLAVAASDTETVNSIIGFTEWSETKPVVTVEYAPNGTIFLPKTGNAKREAAALKFMEFVTGPAYVKYVQEIGQVPTLKGVDVPPNVSQPMLDIRNVLPNTDRLHQSGRYCPELRIL
jgi:raffinose/stachyose/melibiose transport system substrate-binding protein